MIVLHILSLKNVTCFSQVIVTCLGEREMMWEHRPTARVSSAFRVLPNFHKCFFNQVETWRICFQFLLENTRDYQTVVNKINSLFFAPSLVITSTACARHVFLSCFTSINLLASYQKCHSFTGHATHYLFCDRQLVAQQCTLVKDMMTASWHFEVSLERIQIKLNHSLVKKNSPSLFNRNLELIMYHLLQVLYFKYLKVAAKLCCHN